MKPVKKDKRDIPSWVVLELSREGEKKLENGTLVSSILRDLDVGEDFPVFVPCVRYNRGGKPEVLHLMSGYVFVGSGLDEVVYFRLEKKSYINKVMSSYGSDPYQMRSLSVISDDCITQMKTQLSEKMSTEISIGDEVEIVRGRYSPLEARVADIEGNDAVIVIDLRSIHIITSIPKVFLSVKDKEV